MPSFITITLSFSCIISILFLESSVTFMIRSFLILSKISNEAKRVSGIIKIGWKYVSAENPIIVKIKYFMSKEYIGELLLCQ